MDVRLGDMGLSLLLSAIGSGMAVGVAGMAAIGVWKKLYMQNKIGPFILIAFVGAPLSQTIYGMIIRSAIQTASASFQSQIPLIILGTLTGIAMGYSAWLMGKAGAVAADAMGETGKGFSNYIMVIGIIETISLFILVSTLGALPK